jgi:hypothetical protein
MLVSNMYHTYYSTLIDIDLSNNQIGSAEALNVVKPDLITGSYLCVYTEKYMCCIDICTYKRMYVYTYLYHVPPIYIPPTPTLITLI